MSQRPITFRPWGPGSRVRDWPSLVKATFRDAGQQPTALLLEVKIVEFVVLSVADSSFPSD